MKQNNSLKEAVANLINNCENNQEECEQASVNILAKIRERLEEIGHPTYKVPKNQESLTSNNETNVSSLQCFACLDQIENGDVALSMPCCGSICHVTCMAKISNSHRTMMNHACPHCTKELTEEQETLFIKMNQIIKSFESNDKK